MRTRIIKLTGSRGQSDAVRAAVEVLERGGLVAFPTETVYGVGARADLPHAVADLREAKGRSEEKAFTVHVDSKQAALRYIDTPTGLAQRLMRKVWPGPLTIIVPAPDAAKATAPGQPSPAAQEVMYHDGWVGLRCPDDLVACEILRGAGGPVIASSANAAGNPPPRSGDEVLRDLNDKVDLLIDTGRTRYSKPSSIVQVTGNHYELLREGVYDAGSIARLAALKILFVCTGNTCRSPMAAGLAAKMLADRMHLSVDELAAHGVVVHSAGTAGGFGHATEPAIRAMAHRGIDISQHVSTALTPELVHQSDFVFTMTQSHRDAAIRMEKSAESRIVELLPGEDLADPVGGSDADYEACAQAIERGLKVRIEEILT